MKPYFSIIIPTLNEGAFLSTILQNLVKQKENNFETLVVDGSSEDNTRQVAESFIQVLPISFLQIKKRNPAAQRNFGAQKAQGKYLVFLDADTRITPFFIKKLHAYISKEKGLLFIPHVIPDDANPQNKITFNVVNFLIEASQYIGKPFSTGGSMIVERHLFHTLGGFSETVFIAEDHDLVQKAYKWGVKAKFARSIKIVLSLRRLRKEGQLKLFYKYVVATAHVLLKGKIDRKIFDYEMGGHVYFSKLKSKKTEEKLKKYIDDATRFLKKTFLED